MIAGASAAVFDKPSERNDEESFQEGYTPKDMTGVLHHHGSLKALPPGGLNFGHIAEVQ